MTTIRVLLVDDDDLMRVGLRGILSSDEGIEVVGEASDGTTALEAANRLLPHVVLMDVRMPGLDGIAATERLLATSDDVRVVILRLGDIQVLDATGAHALGEIVRELEARGITVLLKGVRPEHLRILHAVGVLDRLAHERHLFDRLPDAIAHARSHLTRDPHEHRAA